MDYLSVSDWFSLVLCINQFKTYDAVVGDVTILADRADKVEFTQPYAESGLSMIVPLKFEESAWMFMKPFTWQMWVVTGAILIYTMFIVWFLEHQSNPEFKGPLKNQIGTAVSFTFSSLFFAHSKQQKYSSLSYIYFHQFSIFVRHDGFFFFSRRENLRQSHSGGVGSVAICCVDLKLELHC